MTALSDREMTGRDYVGRDCTLDGRRAVVIGRNNDHATITTLPTGPSYTWSWSAVARIMSNGGRFVS